MSDVDRLRTAAHMLDIVSVPTPLATACAALLRAVAARHVSDSDGERCYGCREPWPCPEAVAAEALADVILGDNDD